MDGTSSVEPRKASTDAGGDHDREAVDFVDDIVGLGFGDRLERQVVGVLDAVGAGDLDAQAERLGLVLVASDLEDLRVRGLADLHDEVGVGIR